MTTTTAERFAEFLQSIGVTDDRVLAWEREMGFGKDSIKKFVDGKTHSIGSDRLEIIGRKYPGLNFNWLLRQPKARNGHAPLEEKVTIDEALSTIRQMEEKIVELRQLLLNLSNKEGVSH